MQTKGEILIVGAGPTGLTLANELNRYQVPCRIIDKLTEPTNQSRAAGIHARTLEVLNNMGLKKRVVAEGLKVTGICMHANDQEIINLDYTIVDSPINFVIMLPQCDTEKLLREHLAKYKQTVNYNTELVNFEQDASVVHCTLKHNGTMEKLSVPYLIGCDGAHSQVRHTLKLDFAGSALKEDWIMADVFADWQGDVNKIHIYMSPEGVFMLFPMPNKRFRIGADHRLQANHETEPTKDEFNDLVGHYLKRPFTIHDFNWITKFRINHRKVNTYQNGRVFVAGDAAHIHSPAGGQGMNTGIQDAYNLAWKLAMVYHGKTKENILDSYTKERSPIAEGVLQETTTLTKLITIKQPMVQKLRNAMMSLVTKFDIVQQQMVNRMAEVSLNYRKSDLNAQDWPAHFSLNKAKLQVGDRAPDIVLKTMENQPIHLFDLLVAPRFATLIFTNGDPGALEQAKTITEKLNTIYKDNFTSIIISTTTPKTIITSDHITQVLDETQAGHDRYAANEPCLYLIRPDGYIGYRNKPLNMQQYLTYLNRLLSH